ncbi:hypothetical protein BDA99DRAFT_426466, partial [Phascolomyces articulosus]
IACEIDQLHWDKSIAYGGAKISEPTNNLNSLGQDLMRLAILGSKSVESLNYSLTFQING